MDPSYDDLFTAAGMAGMHVVYYQEKGGVPRFKDFEPGDTDIYANYSILYESKCQVCDFTWLAAREYSKMPLFLEGQNQKDSEALKLLCSNSYYGDAPRHGGCAGSTMTTIPLKIVKAWRKAPNSLELQEEVELAQMSLQEDE